MADRPSDRAPLLPPPPLESLAPIHYTGDQLPTEGERRALQLPKSTSTRTREMHERLNERMIEREWLTMDSERIPDLVAALGDLLRTGNRVIHIGTDAQKVDARVDFVTCVVVLTPGKGGRVFHTRIRKPREDVRSLRLKLFMEAWYSVETAMELEPHIPDGAPIVVHLDVNPDKRWASSRHISEVVGLVMGQGFEVLFKPDAWAASRTADHVVKNKHQAALSIP